ncbi:hypothetical protein DM02DRAFT_54141 [Periconia macrospinosa]|uniref:REJ domain-containing protein n=1 Tax=Periconia macrospinosa TaxID=97972 RepID=A0A2V1E982_9PLEO|nr:hypothetical protein DM02DRAFT_54141 [Periconia macrospinosa]
MGNLHRIWQVWLASTSALGGHASNDTSCALQTSPLILRTIPSSEPEILPPAPPSPATTSTSTPTPPPCATPLRTLTNTVLYTSSDVFFVTSSVGSVSAPPHGATATNPGGAVMPSFISSSSLEPESSLLLSASSVFTFIPAQISTALLSSGIPSSSDIISSSSSALPSTSTGTATSTSPNEISSQITNNTPAVTRSQTTLATSSPASSSNMALQTSGIASAPGVTSGSGSSWGASKGKEKVWWVTFLVPLLVVGS